MRFVVDCGFGNSDFAGLNPLQKRFVFKLSTGYARDLEEESTILARRLLWRKDDPTNDVPAVVTGDQFLELQRLVEEEVYVDRSIVDYISQLVRATREHPKVEVGSSPRGGLALLKTSRALALIRGRDFVTPDDVKHLVVNALAHRVILRIEEALEGVTSEDVVGEVVAQIPAPREQRKESPA